MSADYSDYVRAIEGHYGAARPLIVTGFEISAAQWSSRSGIEADGLWHSYTWHGDHWVENMTEGDLGIELAWESKTWRIGATDAGNGSQGPNGRTEST